MWNKLYDSLFVVMNEDSDVLTWQLTKGTSIDNVDSLLRGLHNRLTIDGERFEGTVVDNCCSVKNNY